MTTGHMAPSSMAIKHIPSIGLYNPSIAPRLGVHASVAFPKAMSFRAAYQERKALALSGGPAVQFSGSSAPFARGDLGGLGHVIGEGNSVRRRASVMTAASKKFVYPPMTSKPQWWWRTVACVPYLRPLHEAWMYAYVFRLNSLLEEFEFLATPFLHTMELMPRWFILVFMYGIYFGVVRRKELPHFVRFHIVMSLLLSMVLEATVLVAGWMPGIIFKGSMAYLWTAFAFAEMLAVVTCMVCSLRGMYADVPFVSNAAYVNLSI